ncbi:MAG: hypothetical protein PVI97_08560 [Candidatus Thiodiazotropha sp.]
MKSKFDITRCNLLANIGMAAICVPLAGLIGCGNDSETTSDAETTDESQSDDSSTFAGGFCTANEEEAENSTWFRGELTTDSSGRVNFKTCFPGWYSGRTIHIHFRIRLEYGGTDYIVSQFCFDDDFCEDICTNHSLYSDRGVQDTPLSSGTDTVFPNIDYENYMMNTSQNSDGSLLGYKRIMIET